MEMGDLISRNALIERYGEPCHSFLDVIETMPAVDAEPVRHGRWRHLGGDEWCCTMCGEVIHTEGSWERPSDKYCRECGARMDGEVRKQWMKQK